MSYCIIVFLMGKWSLHTLVFICYFWLICICVSLYIYTVCIISIFLFFSQFVYIQHSIYNWDFVFINCQSWIWHHVLWLPVSSLPMNQTMTWMPCSSSLLNEVVNRSHDIFNDLWCSWIKVNMNQPRYKDVYISYLFSLKLPPAIVPSFGIYINLYIKPQNLAIKFYSNLFFFFFFFCLHSIKLYPRLIIFWLLLLIF